jgi:hypothetical protein
VEGLGGADLASGQLRAYAFSFTSPDLAGVGTEAFGEFTDTLTILPPGAGITFSDDATLILTVDGDYVNAAYIYGQILASGMFAPQSVTQYCNQPVGGVITDSGSVNSCQLSIQLSVPFSNSDPTFTFTMLLLSDAAGTGIADAYNTAQAGVILPPGYTFESGSGVFLTSQQPDTPEPASIVLLSVGLAALIGIKRRRDKTT